MPHRLRTCLNHRLRRPGNLIEGGQMRLLFARSSSLVALIALGNANDCVYAMEGKLSRRGTFLGYSIVAPHTPSLSETTTSASSYPVPSTSAKVMPGYNFLLSDLRAQVDLETDIAKGLERTPITRFCAAHLFLATSRPHLCPCK